RPQIAVRRGKLLPPHDLGLLRAPFIPFVRDAVVSADAWQERHRDQTLRRAPATRATRVKIRLAHRPPIAERAAAFAGVVVTRHGSSFPTAAPALRPDRPRFGASMTTT